MADIRCPMCGKLNDETQSACQYCQARLRPIWAETSAESENEHTDPQDLSGNEAHLPDWWQSLRDDAEQEMENDPGDSDQELDWIDSLRNLPEDEQANQVNEEWSHDSKIEEESSDWLTRMRSQAGNVESQNLRPEPLDDEPDAGEQEVDRFSDWLASDDRQEQEELPDWMQAEEAAIPDWLEDTDAEEAVYPTESIDDEPAPTEEDKGIGLLSRLRRSQRPESPAEDGKSEESGLFESPEDAQKDDESAIPDWLASATREEAPPKQIEDEEDKAAEGWPEWARQTTSEEPSASEIFEEAPAERADLPDWLITKAEESETAAQARAELEAEEQDKYPESGIVEEDRPIIEGELPDWLVSEAAEPQAEAAALEPEEAAEPDWLAELPGVESETETAADALPDWLAEEETAAADEIAEGELPDWLVSEAAEPQAEAAALEPEETAEPDWLAELPGAESETETAADALPDWLAEEETAAADEIAEGELPGWLVSEAAEPQSEAAALEPEEAAEPDWLAELPGAESEPETAADALPDWLAEEETAAADEIAEGELPGWLVSEAAEPQADAGPLESEGEAEPDWLAELPGVEYEPETAAVDLPDWLAEDTTPEDAVTEGEPSGWLVSEAAEPQADAGPLEPEGDAEPDWLAEIGPSGEITTETGEAPPWLQDSELPEEALKPAIPIIEGDEEDLPDWLKSSEEQMPSWLQDEGVVQAESESQQEMDLPSWMMDDISDETSDALADESERIESPTWLSSLPDQSSEILDITFAAEGEEQPEDDLSWLTELEDSYPAFAEDEGEEDLSLAEAQTASPFDKGDLDQFGIEQDSAEDLSGWLASEGEQEQEVEAFPEGEAGEGEELSPAQLPGWLEAMRPVDSVAAPLSLLEADAAVEGAGPLAGLKGVLPAEPDISYVRKPAAHSIKLKVSEEQKSNADLLRQLVEAESDEPAIRPAPMIRSLYILRIGIAIVLSLAVLIPLFMPGALQIGISASPALTADVLNVNQMVDGLAPGSPVLFAVDYDPGMIGEMDAVTGIVLEHLAQKNIPMALVSTSATGPLQIERLLSEINIKSETATINLGYIPGGPAGLLSFALSPQDVFPRAIDGGSPWNELRAGQANPLHGVTSVADFSMVIIATEKPDTGRVWIEQVQPHMQGKPMTMLISAQAEPIIRPYYEAVPPKVNGLLSGLASSVVYENLMGKGDGPAHVYWSPFSIGLLVVVGLILIGAGLNLTLNLLAGRESVSEDGE